MDPVSITPNEQFLLDMRDAAVAAKHVWPEYAACEAVLESGWGKSGLFKSANNVFGNKAPKNLPKDMQTLVLPTREWINGHWIETSATWLKFDSLIDAFVYRMKLLKQLTMYSPAVQAKTGQDYVMQVSAQWQRLPNNAQDKPLVFGFGDLKYLWMGGRWATYPSRAHKVLEIYEEHKDIFAPAPEPAVAAPDEPKSTEKPTSAA